MKYIGLDLGSRTLGVSISDDLAMFARTYDTIRFQDDDYDYALEELLKILSKEHVDTCILGYPKHMNGDKGIRAAISEDFKSKLENNNINVILWDERLTTITVDRMMISSNVRREKRKEKKDELAAQVILQDYLNSKN